MQRVCGEYLGSIRVCAYCSARPGEGGPRGRARANEGATNNFLCSQTLSGNFLRLRTVTQLLAVAHPIKYDPRMKSFPLTAREVKATEAVLTRIYNAAKRSLRGEKLAAACDLQPGEYQQLRALDPLVEMAELKGRADAEMELSGVIYAAAVAGDTKAAEMILKHQHDWVAKQQVQVNVAQQISITAALAQAESRVLETVEEVTDARAPVLGGPRAGVNGQALESVYSERP